MNVKQKNRIVLPPPKRKGVISLEAAIAARRSTRDFSGREVPMESVAQILWAGNGLSRGSRRTIPSAGATYPLELYLVTGRGCVSDLKDGVYHYLHTEHQLALRDLGDRRGRLASACISQGFIGVAPFTIVIAADFHRTTRYYGNRGINYVYMEAGHSGQNISLQAEVLGLGSVMVGAFRDEEVASLLGLPEEHHPLYVIPVGYPS